MNDVVIRVENLGKKYRIGAKEKADRTFREVLMDIAGAPFRRIRRLGRAAPAEETIWALKDVSLEVKRGEVLGIIGRNGAGKSTLLKILSRITEPTEGRAEIRGRVASLLEVGTGFHPELTGRENIYLNGAVLGMTKSEIQRKFDEIVAFSEIEKFLDTPVKRYSSGMYVRLAFAVAAHLEPDILLVDEVLAVGDVQFQRKCLGKMREVGQKGRTVLLVSHNLASIQNLCGAALLLDKGRVTHCGEPDAVISAYIGMQTRPSSYQRAGRELNDSRCKITRLRLLNAGGSPCDQFPMADPMIVEADIWAPRAFQDMQLGFELLTSSGVRLVVAATWIKTFPLNLEPGQTSLRVRIDALRVAPGGYTLTFGLYKLPGEQHDFLPNCVSFWVVEKDILGTGHLPTGRGQGLTWLDYEFEVGR